MTSDPDRTMTSDPDLLEVKDETGRIVWGIYRNGNEIGDRAAAIQTLTTGPADITRHLLAAMLILAPQRNA